MSLRVAARAAETFFLAIGFAVASERARAPAAEGALDFDLLLALVAAFAARTLTASARAAAAFFALSSADCLDDFVLAVPTCFACFALDDFTVFFADTITSCAPLSFPGVETGRILTADIASADRRICISALKMGQNEMLLNDDNPAKIRPDLRHKVCSRPRRPGKLRPEAAKPSTR